MKKIAAFTPDYDHRVLFHTARSTREAEFDYLMADVAQHVGERPGLRQALELLAHDLRGGIYISAADAFLRAADYLREHRGVLTGSALDPTESSE